MSLEPFVQFRGDSHLVYYQSPFNKRFCHNDRQRSIMLKARESAYTGEMSEGAKRRLKKSLSLLIQASKSKVVFNTATGREMMHRVSFCTLTIGSGDDPIISMEKAKLLLEDFLQWLYHTRGVRLRVWKGELQKRGQPHFHLVFPEFIDHRDIRKKWNEIQRKHRTTNGYATRHKHFNPPSTEIKEAYQKGTIVEYLAKEMSKETEAVKVEMWAEVRNEVETGLHPALASLTGRDLKAAIKKIVNQRYAEVHGAAVEKGKIWDCSEVLSQTGYFTLPMSNRHQAFFEDCVRRGLATANHCEDGWWSLIKWVDRPPPGFFDAAQEHEYDAYVNTIVEKADGSYIAPEKPVATVMAIREVEPVPVITGWAPMQVDLFNLN